jgi:tellurite resistance protein
VAAAPAAPAAPARQEDRHLLLLDLTVQFACLAARTDGSISQKERALIEEDLLRRYRYDTALSNRARSMLAHYESAAIDRDSCLRRIADEFEPGHRQALLTFASRIAEACGPMNKKERQFLERVASQWGIPWQALQPAEEPPPQPAKAPPPTAAAPPVPSREQQLAVLEIEPATPLTADLIRRQYHLLMERLNPDKVQSMGVDVVATVKRKRDAVSAAARALIEPFGEPLDKAAEAPPAELRHNPDLDDVFGA